VLAVFSKANRVNIEMDLDMYQILDMYRDAKAKLKCLNVLGLCLVLSQLVLWFQE